MIVKVPIPSGEFKATSEQVDPALALSIQQYRHHLLAACMMHMEGYYSVLSVAFRNHNPGNIKYGPGGAFKVFDTALEGYAALVRDIGANTGKTLREFISKYAPPIENNTDIYIDVVSRLSEIGKDEIL
jgi:hypothetical protein